MQFNCNSGIVICENEMIYKSLHLTEVIFLSIFKKLIMGQYYYSLKGEIMKTRRGFIEYILVGISIVLTAVLAVACGAKPDAETEPSPEWPPKDE